ncbi:type II secretion system F family protein [Cellulomonas alba]|uniref:Type II secretion system F family protein n=1 Tax=Cellulomonas alba TaxID=3053467 RepID=A0ABT7SM30_9CELL|nr:type II secretion system F family protein [Cellulomonas alba]MDM7856622.1 type II secretion system F family protein [Cellulomonas alba]
MSPAAQGALVGLLGGLGALLVVSRLRARRIRLDDRLAPYLRAARTESALIADAPPVRGPLAALERLAAPLLLDAQRLVARLGSPATELRRRLQRAGRTETVEQFRAGQVVSGALGLAATLTVALALAASRPVSVLALVVLVGVGGVAGVLLRDWSLTRDVRRREQRIVAELPTVAELLALAVAAGEGPLGALERVVASAHGALAAELGLTLADVRSGVSLVPALDALAARTGVSSLARFAEGIAVAVERGTPLADVLRAQAQDVREHGRRELMESGGRKEVAMMVPVVFLILPVTVVFAAFTLWAG